MYLVKINLGNFGNYIGSRSGVSQRGAHLKSSGLDIVELFIAIFTRFAYIEVLQFSISLFCYGGFNRFAIHEGVKFQVILILAVELSTKLKLDR